jgi:hypothetical protein
VTTAALARAVQVLGLHDVEMVAIFHISPAELAQWKRSGVPPDHAAAVGTVEDIAKRLAVWLEPGPLQHFVRVRRAELGGRPLLQLLAEDGPDAVHAEIDRMLAAGELP